MNKEIKKTGTGIRKKHHHIIRLCIQIMFFIAFPSAYSASFAGVKYIFTQLGVTEMIKMTPFVAALTVLCLYTILFGRFFCGYACAFGSLGDWVFGLHTAISRIRGKKSVALSARSLSKAAWIKYVILAAICLLCLTGIFDKTTGYSPWDAFSQIRSGTFSLSGYTIGLILLAFILAGMYFSERFFCRVLCPMGAVFSILPVIPLFSLKRKKADCIPGCSACARNCPSCIELPSVENTDVQGDCFMCGKCAVTCPGQNILLSRTGVRADSVVFTLLRAAVLASLFIWLGV